MYSETTSDAHTNTGHVPATHSKLDLPAIYIPDEFWNCRSKSARDFVQSVNHENMVNHQIFSLVQDIVSALGFSHFLEVVIGTPIIDTVPNFSILRRANKMPIAAGEGKKPEKETEAGARDRRAIFGSGTEVCGEVFEQLHLMGMYSGKDTVGILSTHNTWTMVSTSNDLKEVTAEDFETILQHFLQDKCTDADSDAGSEGTVSKKRLWLPFTQPKPPQNAMRVSTKQGKKLSKSITTKLAGKAEKGKNGSVAQHARRKHVPRTHFQSKPLEWVSEGREIIQLVAQFVIQAVWGVMQNDLSDAVGPLDRCKDGIPCRIIDVARKSFIHDEVIFPQGIDLKERPSAQDTIFYIVQQLGCGAHGVCCLASNNEGHVCVVKFLHGKGDLATFAALAKKEKNNWDAVYKDWFQGVFGQNCLFVESNSIGPRQFLFLPFFAVPVDYADRQMIIGDDNFSPLREALFFFADKQKIHTDLKWEHVGYYLHGDDGDIVVDLLDLGEGVIACDDTQKRTEWVKSSFEQLKRKLDAESLLAIGPKIH